MPDEFRRLHDLLEQLHRELEAAENIDAQTEGELRTAIDEIRASLATRTAEEPLPEDEDAEDTSRQQGVLSDAAQEFTASHPWIARTIGQIADILGQSGI